MEPYAPYPLNLVRDWFHRRRWWVRLALAAVLVPWFGPFAYTRWTGEPSKPLDLYGSGLTTWDSVLERPDPAVDRTKDMVAAIRSLPMLPTVPVPTTAPAGMTWLPMGDNATALMPASRPAPGTPGLAAASPAAPTFQINIDVALSGDWKPRDRYHLQQAIGYIEQPATSAALDRIRPLIGQPYCLSHSGSGMGGPAGGACSEVRQLARLLTSRARYHMAQKRDFAAALQDIDTVLQLAADTEREHLFISVLAGVGTRRVTYCEVCLWEREFGLSADERRRVAEMIQRHQIDVAELASTSFEVELRFTCTKPDMIYTRNADGNGWMVLHRREPGLDWLACKNLLSPLFDDRRETLGRLDQLQKDARETMDARLKDSLQADPSVRSAETERFPTSPWLPFALQSAADFRLPQYLYHASAHGAAAITIHAIEGYHRQHGHYPPALSSLVPEMLAALPPDPCSPSQAPLRYRLDKEEGYVLYSVGIDGRDDGGMSRPGGSGEADWVFRTRRSGLDSAKEWILAPAGTQKPQATQPLPFTPRGRRGS